MKSESSIFVFGQGALIGYLAFLSAFVPLSTDLYLPALPSLATYFNVSPELTNLTLSSFMLIYALSMLVWGPFSDKYGRRPILLIGFVLYALGSVGSAMSLTIWHLLMGRCLQALGSGAVSAVAMAIVKDGFKGRTMESVLTWIQTMTVLAPMLAPVIGGMLLTVTTWRGIFWSLTVCGFIAFAGSFALRESLKEPTQGSALHALTRVPFVLRHSGFRSLLLVFSLAAMPFMAYLATSSYIFVDDFKVSPQIYSYYFAANAAFSMLGPVFYVRFFRDIPKRTFLAANFLATGVAGVLLIMFGHSSPLIFTLIYLPVTFCGSALRPPSTVLMMNQLDTDNGTVAALIGSAALLFGSFAMLISSLPPMLGMSFITSTGLIATIIGAVCLVGWLSLDSRNAYRKLENGALPHTPQGE